MPTPTVTVADLLGGRSETAGLPLEVLSGGRGLHRVISSPHIQKTGLALAGFHEFLRPGRVLVFGLSEVRYLECLADDARMQTLTKALAQQIPCVLVTGGAPLPAEMLAASDHADVPVIRTTVATPLAIAKVTALLEYALADREIVHGVLVDVLGLGVLIVGDSGIGKSECALDLIVRGHRLVADDTVEVRRRAETAVIGTCPELTRHHMEVRGLGVINIQDLFGVASTRTSKHIELVVHLERWDRARAYDRLGLDVSVYDLFGVKVPLVHMPVAPGRNLAILVEVAARNQLLRRRGLNAARDLAARLEQELRDGERERSEDGSGDDDEHGGPA